MSPEFLKLGVTSTSYIDTRSMSETHEKAPSEDHNTENAISDALASLSLTTELDSALLDHLNLLDKYMFHKECLSQLFRMVCRLKGISLR